MTQEREKTAWMWLSGDALRGLSLDRETGILTWIWQAGCHCSDEDAIVQDSEHFQQEGAPSLIGPLPDEIAREVREALGRLRPSHHLDPSA